jgi:hypothetical protein
VADFSDSGEAYLGLGVFSGCGEDFSFGVDLDFAADFFFVC